MIFSGFCSMRALIDRRTITGNTPEKYGDEVRAPDFTLTTHIMRHTFAA